MGKRQGTSRCHTLSPNTHVLFTCPHETHGQLSLREAKWSSLSHNGGGTGERGRVNSSDDGCPCTREVDSGTDEQEEQQAERWVYWRGQAAALVLRIRNTGGAARGGLGEMEPYWPACPSYCPPARLSMAQLCPDAQPSRTCRPNLPPHPQYLSSVFLAEAT